MVSKQQDHGELSMRNNCFEKPQLSKDRLEYLYG